jgi:tetratricopeptide (TPR) repeat protein
LRLVSYDFRFYNTLLNSSRYLCERGRFEISSKLIQTAEDVYQTLEGKESDPFRADLRTVKLYYANETDHHNSSIDLATEALDIREEAVRTGLLEEDHPNRANGFMNLAVMYAKVDPEKAIELNLAALTIRTKTTRFKAQQIHGLALNHLNLGRSYWCAGRLDEAATSFETCLATIKAREESCGRRFAL